MRLDVLSCEQMEHKLIPESNCPKKYIYSHPRNVRLEPSMRKPIARVSVTVNTYMCICILCMTEMCKLRTARMRDMSIYGNARAQGVKWVGVVGVWTKFHVEFGRFCLNLKFMHTYN